MAVGRLVAMSSGTVVRAATGIESVRVASQAAFQQDADVSKSFLRRIATCTFDFARLSSARVRCGATTTTSTMFRDGVLEREVRGDEDIDSMSAGSNSRAHASRCFEAEADVGRVECNGKGCRPVYEEEPRFLSVAYPVHDEASSWSGGFPSHADLHIKIQPQVPREAKRGRQGRFLNQTAATTRSFEVALQDASHDSQHLSDFAVFSWKSLGDMDKVEELYQEALDASPDDTDILASYASFLWQCDEQ